MQKRIHGFPAEMAGSDTYGDGSYPLFFRIYREDTGLVFHAGKALRTLVFVLSAGGFCSHQRPEKVFSSDLRHCRGYGAAAVLFPFYCKKAGWLCPPKPNAGHLFYSAVMLQGIDWCGQKKWGRGLCAILFPAAWPFIGLGIIQVVPAAAQAVILLHYSILPMHLSIMDGGTYFILEGILLYAFRKRRALQAVVFFVLALVLEGVLPFLLTPGATADMLFTQMYGWMSGFAAIPMFLYNGKRGKGSKKLFYWFYPAHVYLLYGISWVMQLL